MTTLSAIGAAPQALPEQQSDSPKKPTAPQPREQRSLQGSDAASQLKSLLGAGGVYDLSGGASAKGWIRATGSDRVRWLNGMATNSIQQLQPGQGCYNFILSAQGRIQGDCYAFAQPESLLIETGSAQVAPLMELLDRFIIMDDVELRDESAERAGIGVAGPKAAEVLAKLNVRADAPGIQLSESSVDGVGDVRVVAAYSPGVPRFEVWSRLEAAQGLRHELLRAGAAECGADAVEWLRILEGEPRYGTDIRDKDLPQETAQARALHFAKGCYIGQEIVERIRSRGAVHRTFSGFELRGDLPESPGAPLEADGQKVGELTSFARIPLPSGEAMLALGYVRRDAVERKSELRYAGGVAEAISLPLRDF